MKRRYTREDLEIKDTPNRRFFCALCRESASADIKHAETCPFQDNAVEAVVLILSKPSVVLRRYENCWWWRSPARNIEYRIEMRGRPGSTYYVMHDHDGGGNQVCGRARLSDIRHWIFLNQGTL
jgi:RimJ/RimL family protein N-acetyltransferase